MHIAETGVEGTLLEHLHLQTWLTVGLELIAMVYTRSCMACRASLQVQSNTVFPQSARLLPFDSNSVMVPARDRCIP